MSITHLQYQMGIIGNCNFLAYVNKSATINWLCWPRIDSSFVFGSLLDSEQGGHFSICPHHDHYESIQYYQINTNILVTEFNGADFAFRVIDFAPRFGQYGRFFKPLMIVRKIELIRGTPQVIIDCRPTYDYGRQQLKIMRGSNHILFQGAPEEVRLTTTVPLTFIQNKSSFVLSHNHYLFLTYGRPIEADITETAESFLEKTANYWQTWVMRSSIPSIYQSQVIRSSLLLKLHQYEDTGAIIAAGTTSLPEAPNTQRNWDYRYCWPRDAYHTLQAFNSISHFSELESYSSFMQNLVIQTPSSLQPLYTIDGSSRLDEIELSHLSGFYGHRPVRVGNGAYHQEQFDIYGQILLSMLPLFIDQRLAHKKLSISKNIVKALINNIENSFERPDSGIWEFRQQLRHHTHTYLFHWAGASAAEKMGLVFRDEELVKRARVLKERASTFIEKAYDPKRKCYAGSIDHEDLDASTLLLINMHYLHPGGGRAIDHVAAIERELTADNGLLYRYRHLDDFGATDSCFLVCSFWMVEALARIGNFAKAKEHLERLFKCGNHLGLFSEDIYGPNFQQWGNFPQTYCHVGLINSIFALDKAMDREIFQLPI